MPRARRRACRDPRVAQVAGLEDVAQGAERAVPVGVHERVERADDVVDLVADVTEDVAHGRCVAGQDLGPQAGVAGGDPGHVTQPLSRESDGGLGQLAQTRGDDARGELRHVRHGRDGLVVLVRRHDADGRADGERELAHPTDRCVGGGLVGDDDPGAAVEEVGPGSRRSRALPAGHRVRADVAARVGSRVEHDAQHRLLDGGDVGDDGVGPPVERGDDDSGRDVGRCGDDDDVGGVGLVVGHLARLQVACKTDGRRGRVVERHAKTAVGQGDPQAGTDQPGADDTDVRGHHASVASTTSPSRDIRITDQRPCRAPRSLPC